MDAAAGEAILNSFPPMKKVLAILLVALFAGCAAKDGPFDAGAKFAEAEKYMRKDDFEKARKAYQEIQEKAPDKSYDADIMLRIADTYFGEEKYDEALVEYQAFLNFHPVHRNAAYAQFQIAMCSFKQLPTIDRDPVIVRTALREFEKLIQKYPDSLYADRASRNIATCREHLSQYELYVAKFYYKKGSYQAALGRLENMLKDYPDSLAEKDALYHAGLAYREIGDRSRATAVLDRLAKKYPSMQEKAESVIRSLKGR